MWFTNINKDQKQNMPEPLHITVNYESAMPVHIAVSHTASTVHGLTDT
jgi:hypothetical protein